MSHSILQNRQSWQQPQAQNGTTITPTNISRPGISPRNLVLLLTSDNLQSRETLDFLQELIQKETPTPSLSTIPHMIIHQRPFCIIKLRLSVPIEHNKLSPSSRSFNPTPENRDENLELFVKTVTELSHAKFVLFLARPDEIVRMHEHRIFPSIAHMFKFVVILQTDLLSSFAFRVMQETTLISKEDKNYELDASLVTPQAVQQYLQTWDSATRIIQDSFIRQTVFEHNVLDYHQLARTLQLPRWSHLIHSSTANHQRHMNSHNDPSRTSWDTLLTQLPETLRNQLILAFNYDLKHIHRFKNPEPRTTRAGDIVMKQVICNSFQTIENLSSDSIQFTNVKSGKHDGDNVQNESKALSVALLLPVIYSNNLEVNSNSILAKLQTLIIQPTKSKLILLNVYVCIDSSVDVSKWKTFQNNTSAWRVHLVIADAFENSKVSYASTWTYLASLAVSDGHDYLALLQTPWVPKTSDWNVMLYDLLNGLHEKKQHPTSQEIFSKPPENKFGLVAIATGYSLSNFVSAVIVHSNHFQKFPNLLPESFHDPTVLPSDCFAFLRTLYSRFDRAFTFCVAGPTVPKNNPDRSIRYKETILSRNLLKLSRELGTPQISIDVVVPTFRVPLHVLQKITSLRATIPAVVRFWLVVDNPNDTTGISNLLSSLDGTHENGNYVVSVHIHPENLGAARARNTGLALSDADWVVMLDDDVDPESGLLDAYIAATLRYPEARILTGVTHFPKPKTLSQHALVSSDLLYFFAASEQIPHMPWPVTANTCVRARLNNNFLFMDLFPKGGGGEDIDYGLRFKGKLPTSIVSVPNARVKHPWIGSSYKLITSHIINYMKGDSVIEAKMADKTYAVLPGWCECLLLFAPLSFCFKGFYMMLIWIVFVVVLELLCRAVTAIPPSYKSTSNILNTLPVAVLAATYHMAQDAARVFYSTQRREWRPFFRRLDRLDGLKNMRPTQIAMGLRSVAVLVALFAVLLKR